MELTLTGASTLRDRSGAGVVSGRTGVSSSSQQSTLFPPSAATATSTATATATAGGGGLAHSHSHSHAHGHGHGQKKECCSHDHGSGCSPSSSSPSPSSLLPSDDQFRRFLREREYRLEVLANVVRGGTYDVFLNLVSLLALPEKAVDKINSIAEGNDENNDDDQNNNDNKQEEEEEEEEDEATKARREDRAYRMLDGHGADGHTLAHWCAKRGDEPRFLSFLVAKSYRGGTTITKSGGNDDGDDEGPLLINLHRPSKDSVGMYPLHWAVTEGAVPLAATLLRHLEDRPRPSGESSPPGAACAGAPIDARDAAGCAPLLVASQYGHADLAAFLVRRGADPTSVDNSGDTALHWAAYKGSTEVCGMLLHVLGTSGGGEEVERNLELPDKFGQRPLHLASLRGNAEAVRFLIEEAAAADDGSSDALSGGGNDGASSGRVGSRGAGGGGGGNDATGNVAGPLPGRLLAARDAEGKTPLDLAIKKKRPGCESLLRGFEERHGLDEENGRSSSDRLSALATRIARTCRGLASVQNWKAWMGAGGADVPVSQSPTLPFYWMTVHLLAAGIMYARCFLGIRLGGVATDKDAALWDKLGLHFFFFAVYIATWAFLYLTWRTNPGILDARRGTGAESSSGRPPALCRRVCWGGGRRGGRSKAGGGVSSGGSYSRDAIAVEMEAVTLDLRRRYDETIESFGSEFSDESEIARPPLCHTCRIARPLRSKHCKVARRCVLVFDHHCPFVGTTVALYNYMYFYLFLIFFSLTGIGFMAAWILVLHRSSRFPWGTFASGFYILMYAVPVMGMVGYHTRLLLGNITTNEQMNFRRYRYFWDGETGGFRNPFDQGRLRNILSKVSPARGCYTLVPVTATPPLPGSAAPAEEGSFANEGNDDNDMQGMLRNVV